MPSFTITIEDTSPLLQYFQDTKWMSATSRNDDFIDSYSQSSATITSAQNSTMQFSYYGTSVSVFGAKRPNHGTYQGQLDGGAPSLFEGGTPDQYQVELFNGTGSLGTHTVTMTNLENKFFDIDFITFETSVGRANEDLIVNTFQDTDPVFSYTPPGSWVSPLKASMLSGSSGHGTTEAGAIAKLIFEGDAIAIYGPVGPNNTDKYSVQVDNKSPMTYSAHHQFFKAQEMLFFEGNLGPGVHFLQIQLGSPTDGGELVIDYANVFTTSSLGGSFSGDNVLSSSSLPAKPLSLTKSTIPPGIIAGFALMITLVVAAFFGFFYLYFRQQRNIRKMQDNWKFIDLTSSGKLSPSPPMSSTSSVFHQTHETANDVVVPIPYTPKPQGPPISQFKMTKIEEAYNLEPKRGGDFGANLPQSGSSSRIGQQYPEMEFMSNADEGNSSQIQRLPQLSQSLGAAQRQRSGSSRSPLPQTVNPASPGAPPPRYSTMTRQ